MQKSEQVRLIDAAIALISSGHTVKEIAETLNVKEAVVKAIESKLEIVRF